MRHGDTKYQAEGKFSHLYAKEEQMTLPIIEEARKVIQSRALELKGKKIDLIYASDYLRTQQTAKIVSKEVGAKIIPDKRLRDTDFGIFSGSDAKEYQEFFAFPIEKFSKKVPEGENLGDVKKRALEALGDIEKKHKNKTILIVSHGDPVWLLMGFFYGIGDEQLLETKNSPEFYPATAQYFDLTQIEKKSKLQLAFK